MKASKGRKGNGEFGLMIEHRAGGSVAEECDQRHFNAILNLHAVRLHLRHAVKNTAHQTFTHVRMVAGVILRDGDAITPHLTDGPGRRTFAGDGIGLRISRGFGRKFKASVKSVVWAPIVVRGQTVALTMLLNAGRPTGFTDPSATFPLLDPSTGNPVGATISHGEVYAVLWSLYMALAAERDAAIVEEPPPVDFRDRFGAD